MGTVNKILIIDDEKDIRESIGELFELIGKFSVVDLAEEGNQALSLIKENEYDAILTDINMPNGMGGIELIEECFRNNLIENVYVMSGYSENEKLMKKYNIKEYFPKPFSNIKEVVEFIKNTGQK